MRIDQTHRNWFLVSVVVLAAAAVAYIPYSERSPAGPTGGSVMGLVYGSAGSAFILFAGLLSARKTVRTWRLGRATSWMRGHLWLGALSFPLILFHGGFHFGGALTRALMWLFVAVYASGFFGAALQHFMPRFTTERLPMETIYEQIGRVREKLLAESAALVEEAQGALTGNLARATSDQLAAAASAGTIGGLTVASGLQVNEEARNELAQFYENEMRPFLSRDGGGRLALAEANRSRGMFQQLHIMLPAALHPIIDDLENIAEEKRQLDRQRLYHNILHGWLLVHIPASYSLLALGAVHAVVALRY